MTTLATLLGLYSIAVTLLAWDARQSWGYWRRAAKEARAMREEERKRGDRLFEECTRRHGRYLTEEHMDELRAKVLAYDWSDESNAPAKTPEGG